MGLYSVPLLDSNKSKEALPMKKRLLMSILPVIALVGLSSAAAAPKPADVSTVVHSDGGMPVPLCWPPCGGAGARK